MKFLRKIINTLLSLILGNALILFFKFNGPPNLLLFSSRLNKKILELFGATIGKNVFILSPLICAGVKANNGYQNLIIGDNCRFGGNIFLDLTERIVLESGVSLGANVTIITHNRYNNNTFLEDRLFYTCGKKEVILKKGANIKSGALLSHGIIIGENAVVSGNSFVNFDVPDNCVVSGVPAKIVIKLD
ncbi:MAG: acyltransferase [Candidatus Latescibacteria bacterium]|nr:acyltransferase [Candidatus Latescibacterota bacterium]